jgi:membrane protease YdiL (CAAX protease family)
MLADTLSRQRTLPALLWAGAGAVALLLAQALGIAAYVAGMRLGSPGHSLSTWEILHSPSAIAGSTVLATPAIVAFFWGLARLRSAQIADYLALRWPSLRGFFLSALALVLFLAALSVLPQQLFRAGDENFLREMVSGAKAAGTLPLLFIAVVIAAPIGEELAFRGFLYRTFELRFGAAIAILVTALGWTALHIQYSGAGMMVILACGLLLGTVRRYSGSLYLTMILHGMWNGAALASAMLAGPKL